MPEVLETPAATAAASASAKTEFNAWDEKGTPIRVEPAKKDPPKAQDPAPAETPAVADPAPQNKEGTADTESDPAPDTEKPRQKTKEDTERRIQELLDDKKSLQRRLDALEREKTSAPRDMKQESQPAAEVKVPSLKQYLEKYFALPENKGNAYEDGVEAWNVVRDAERAKQLEKDIRAQISQEANQRELQSRVDEAKKRYPDFDERIQPAVKAITEDAAIPFPVKAVMNDSPVFVDLMYVLAEPKALADLMQTAKTNPAAAIRKIVLTEQLVIAELAKAKAGKDAPDADKGKETARDESGKFVSSPEKSEAEPKPRAPKPPSEVGGRGTAAEDALRVAAGRNDFASFEAEQNRRVKARLQR